MPFGLSRAALNDWEGAAGGGTSATLLASEGGSHLAAAGWAPAMPLAGCRLSGAEEPAW